eukprot:3392755-Pyramimonas_sp.AAC.1
MGSRSSGRPRRLGQVQNIRHCRKPDHVAVMGVEAYADYSQQVGVLVHRLRYVPLRDTSSKANSYSLDTSWPGSRHRDLM